MDESEVEEVELAEVAADVPELVAVGVPVALVSVGGVDPVLVGVTAVLLVSVGGAEVVSVGVVSVV